MESFFHHHLESWAGAAMATSLLTAGVILLAAGLLYFLLRNIVVRLIARVAERTRTNIDRTLVRRKVFDRLALLIPGIAVHALSGLWMSAGATTQVLELAANLWMLTFGMLSLHALLDSVVELYDTVPVSRQLPLRSVVQVIKLTTTLLVILISISLLIGKSPALLISGLGALSVVLMLVFKDPILGFVAGIQLSANRMLAVGDWLEMPKYQADGDVIEVSLTTVKVRNWDQTITTIPTYALISDSFKNWRGIYEAGGRRIKRSLFVDMNSIRFLTPEDMTRLRKAKLLTAYLEQKSREIDTEMAACGDDLSCPVNGRRLTNIGTFRVYLLAYLKNHPGINRNLIMMVRQLQPTPEGLPLEIYAFTADTAWVAHENVQSDIFDHILAVIREFDLRVFQEPSGRDVLALKSGF